MRYLLAICLVVLPASASYAERADISHQERLYRLARSYEHAEGVPRDYDRALNLYCQAAQEGSSKAAFNIGWMYLNGRGVTRDDNVAAAWFRTAAKSRHEQAMNVLQLLPSADPKVQARCPSPAAIVSTGMPMPSREVIAIVTDSARRFGLDPRLVMAVIAVESSFRADAVSPKNAQGLMQLLPETATRFGVADPLDPQQNVAGGVKYLRWLLDQFDGDIRLALAAYNAGEKAVWKHKGIPPYDETQSYVRRVLSLYKRAIDKDLRNGTTASISQIDRRLRATNRLAVPVPRMKPPITVVATE